MEASHLDATALLNGAERDLAEAERERDDVRARFAAACDEWAERCRVGARQMAAMTSERDEARAALAAARSVAIEAVEEFEDALGYAPEWAKEKWGYVETLGRLRDDYVHGTRPKRRGRRAP